MIYYRNRRHVFKIYIFEQLLSKLNYYLFGFLIVALADLDFITLAVNLP